MSNQDSTIVKILTFEDGTGNDKLDSQLDDTATHLLFERGRTAPTIAEIEAKLQETIYA